MGGFTDADIGWAKRIAGHKCRMSSEQDEAQSAALLGLGQAAARYDATKNDDFRAYAYRRVAGAVVDHFRALLHKRAPVTCPHCGGDITQDLTACELRVLKLAMEDKSNVEVGRTLGMAEKTVSVHFVNIRRKLGVKGRCAMTAKAIKLGLVQ